MEKKNESNGNEHLLQAVQRLTNLVIILVVIIALMPLIVNNLDKIEQFFSTNSPEVKSMESDQVFATSGDEVTSVTDEVVAFWFPADISEIKPGEKRDLVAYGKELIVHTAKYLGPKGEVMQLSNGLNCQNCHLDAGTKVYGNNYGSVASTYPKFRARSGSEEDIVKRVNDCFERSLNGKALAESSKEMRAIVAYIKYIGKNVPKGQKAEGSGLKEFPFLSRAADPIAGKLVYAEKCASCHGENGLGVMDIAGKEYLYPPLWGPSSYNDAAGLYRVTNFAKYVKFNMPLGATHESPQLSDPEAWDVAAFVNSQPRPHKNTPADWPDFSKKPIDHPTGPYADKFPAKQHKYGPFEPIKSFYKK